MSDVVIKQQLVPQANRKSTFGTGNPKKKLVVHQTGNPSVGANAKMHANLQSRGWGASWHIQSDDKEIIQSWPLNYRLWHASTGNASNGGNMVGIGWEICINKDGDYLKSLELAAKGMAKVMRQEGIPMSGLVTHNMEDPKNKWCPAQILSGVEGVNWNAFKSMVQKAYNGNPVTLKPLPKPTNPPKVSKSIDTLAQEVIDGKWGVNPKRRNDLLAAGYNYNAIQSKVNDIFKAKTTTSKPSAEQVAQDIAVGKGGWGNNPERARKLTSAGYNANAVQARVNDILKSKTVPKKVSGPRVGQTVTTRTLYANSASTKNVRSSPVKGYIHSINNSWRNPIRLTNGRNGSWLGFTRPGDIL